MMILQKYIRNVITFFFICFLIFFSSIIDLSAEEVDWIEVAKSNNSIQFIDTDSIKYNNDGLLSVISKYIEINPDDQKIINTNYFLLVVDCERRLFNKLPINGEIKQVENLQEPTNDKLTKKTILNSCSF